MTTHNRILTRLAAACMILCMAALARGQDLENHGTISSRGLIRVKNAVTNIPDTMGGRFEFKGGNQTVPAAAYRNLLLTGTGVKTTRGGDFLVRSDVSISPGVVLKVDSGAVIDLGGKLAGAGYLSGKVRKTEFLAGLTGSALFGGIGAEISWSGAAPDTTSVLRSSGTALTGRGNSSILRYYDIRPRVNAGLDATFVFRYDPVELNGQDESKLVLWSSADNGVTWDVRGGVVDTFGNTITRSGVTSFGLWTASDSMHPLGTFRRAARLLLAAGNLQSAPILTTLQPFVVTVTGNDSVPVPGEQVRFAVITSPAAAQGMVLSDSVVVTDASGQARVMLTLGNRVGLYQIAAVAPGLEGSPVVITATATVGAPASFAVVSSFVPSEVVTRTIGEPFALVVRDAGNNPVPNVLVDFAITRQPAGAEGTMLSTLHALSDTAGRVETYLTLGTKSGRYSVTASSDGIAPVEVHATGLPSVPAVIAALSGGGQQGRVFGWLREPLAVSLADSFGNATAGYAVSFAITGTPEGAAGQRLSPDTSIADTAGTASTLLRLGDKVGEYIVTASAVASNRVETTFRVHAGVGKPAAIALVSGAAQRAAILEPLPQPLVVALVDSGGNPVGGDTVQFAITGAPDDARDQALSVLSAVTDSNGIAFTELTVGDRQGTYTVSATAKSLPGRALTIDGFGYLFLADANNDAGVNIADLTTLIDALRGTVQLSRGNFIRADIDSNRTLNADDRQLLADGLLTGEFDTLGTPAGMESFAGLKPGMAAFDASVVAAELELTSHGLRFNLESMVPLRGLELVLRMKNPADLSKIEVFRRGGMMAAPYRAGGNGIVRIIAYNAENRAIEPGMGTVLRLPVNLEDTSDVEILGVIAADTGNHAVMVPVTRTRAAAGKYPEQFALLQNYPNPFNLETTIEYTVPDATGKFTNMLLQVFDIGGRKIRTLVKGQQESGRYSVMWDGRNEDGSVVASGVYLVRLWSPGQLLVKKMVLTK